MHVASLELCKELYELSGWDSGHYKQPLRPGGRSSQVKVYDLGYLLRKLPEIRLETWHNGQVVIKHFTANGVPEKLERLGRVVIAEADNPEDAACKLAIHLIKEGLIDAGEK